MNILMLSWRGPGHPNYGGAEIVSHMHAKAWVKAGHSVTLFTSSVPNKPSPEIIDGVQIIRKGRQLLTVHLHAFLWYVFSSHPKFDLVIDQFHGIPFFTPLYVSVPKLAFIHEVAKEVWWVNHLHFPLNYIYGFLGYCLEPAVFLLYRNIPFLTVSQSTKNDLEKWHIPKKKITIISNGVTHYEPKASKETVPTIVYLGAIAKDKGIKDALIVFNQLIQKHPTWQFWVVGKGELSYISQLHPNPAIKFWGYVSDDQKYTLLAKAHILLNPSLREGWGLVNLEANSVGTPVIAYDVPGCRDSIQNGVTGFLCAKGDIDGLVRAITNLIMDKTLFDQISKNAYHWSKEFSWEKATTRSLSLLEELKDVKISSGYV